MAAVAAVLVLAASAQGATLVGGTDQPGNQVVRLDVEKRGPVHHASFDWIAHCHKGGAIRSTTHVDEFNRASRAQFADAFKGRVKDGRHKLELRYFFSGKRDIRKGFYFGTFRLSARYAGADKPVKGTCRTRLVRWTARAGGKR